MKFDNLSSKLEKKSPGIFRVSLWQAIKWRFTSRNYLAGDVEYFGKKRVILAERLTQVKLKGVGWVSKGVLRIPVICPPKLKLVKK